MFNTSPKTAQNLRRFRYGAVPPLVFAVATIASIAGLRRHYAPLGVAQESAPQVSALAKPNSARVSATTRPEAPSLADANLPKAEAHVSMPTTRPQLLDQKSSCLAE